MLSIKNDNSNQLAKVTLFIKHETNQMLRIIPTGIIPICDTQFVIIQTDLNL